MAIQLLVRQFLRTNLAIKVANFAHLITHVRFAMMTPFTLRDMLALRNVLICTIMKMENVL